MRILIAVHTYPPGGVGGAEQRAERTARALQRLGHDVRVLSVHWSADRTVAEATDDQYQGIPVRRVWLAGAAPASFAESYDNPTVAAVVSALVAEWRPAVIHQYSGYLTSAAITRVAAAAGVPVVVSLTDYWWFCSRITLVRTTGRPCDGPTPAMCALCRAQEKRRTRWPSMIAPRAMEVIWRVADRVRPLSAVAGLDAQRCRSTVLREQLASAHTLIAPSRYVADAYRRHGLGSPRLQVMRQGVEGARAERRQRLGITIGYLGQIKPHKGVDLLVDAWGRLRPRAHDRLLLVGPSSGEERYRRDLERRTQRWPNVEWREAVSREGIWTVLADLDVLVVPSRWAENSPNSILEAQAVQVPVVGARIGGIPELVEHRVNGLLFQPDDSTDLAAQLQTLIDVPDLLAQLRRGSVPVRTIAEEALDIVRVYEDALGITDTPSS
jgi:glycosyltransferase involved in cell wall biosynthesis